MAGLSRRGLLGGLAVGMPRGASARQFDGATIAWPCDVPSWDPNRRFMADAQPLYKAVFDAPLDQDPRLGLVPGLVRAWKLAADARSLELELREDVRFHDGSRMSSADLRWSFLGRIAAGHDVDTAQAWGGVVDIETPSAARAVMRFAAPAPTAPARLAFLGSFVVPRAYMERVGAAGFAARPVGSGPYRLVEYQADARIVLERNAAYWGPKPALRRITVAIIRDSAARAEAVQAGQVDLAMAVPVHAIQRLGALPALVAEMTPISRVVLLQLRHDLGFADARIRLAAHHAIDKRALSQAFCGGAAAALSLPAVPGAAGHLDDFTFPHDPGIAIRLLAEAGHSAADPARLRLATTSGLFPGDFDMARAIVAMWRKVGIAAALEVIDHARYFELNRGGKLPEATLHGLDVATGDPQVALGALLDPRLGFPPWEGLAPERAAADLADVPGEAGRIAGWRALGREAVAAGAILPLLQGVQTLVRRRALAYRPYGNGWVLPQTMDWVAG